MQNTQDNASTLAYATPAPPAGSGLAAGVWITLAGLALIVLGGCFLIGIMAALNIGNVTSPNPFSPASSGGGATTTAFIVVLYILAITCFAAAVFVMILGIRKLLAIGRT